jgi:hypothetical protein
LGLVAEDLPHNRIKELVAVEVAVELSILHPLTLVKEPFLLPLEVLHERQMAKKAGLQAVTPLHLVKRHLEAEVALTIGPLEDLLKDYLLHPM